MNRPFCNNLKENDRIFDTVTKRQGKVARTPKNERNRRTCIMLDGEKAQRYVDVMQLRFMVDGKPEDVAPVDGVPSEDAAPKPRSNAAVSTAPKFDSALAAMTDEVERNNVELASIEKRFRELKVKNERLGQAIALLKDPITT